MEAAISTINHVAIPVIIALTVTEAGFVSLLSSTVPMINDFGKICIIGLIMCYLSALFVNVTVLYLSEKRSPRKKKAEGHSEDGSSIGRNRSEDWQISVSKDGKQCWSWL